MVKRAAKVKTPIFSTKKGNNQQGVTLLEIMFALVVVAGLISITLPRLRSSDKTRAIMRKLSVLTKQTHSTARLKGIPYRLVVDMTEEPHKIYVERARKQNISAVTYEEKKTESTSALDKPPEPEFAVDVTLMKNPLELPGGFKFEDVEFGADAKDKITSGKAYIYFFPQGFCSRAAIHISDGKEKKFTVSIHPLTGQGYISQSYVSIKDIE